MAWLTGLGGVEAAIQQLAKAGHQAMIDAAEEIAALLETYAKLNHDWGNPYSKGYKPTGNTNTSTKGAITEATEDLIRVTLSAGMDYDVWLELARSGKWAWLWPAIEANQANILKILQKHGLNVTVKSFVSTIPGQALPNGNTP